MKRQLTAALCLHLCLLPGYALAGKEGAASGDSDIVDVVLIGGGTMSVTLGTYLNELEPDWNIRLYERLDGIALESSSGWNNAGTGHSAFCEMNYTPPTDDGGVDISRAIGVTEQFEISRQFWAHQVERGILPDPNAFISSVPHMSLVWGQENVDFLSERYARMSQNPLYAGMQYTEDNATIAEWMPLVMEGREDGTPMAATRMDLGTEVNFGEMTRQMAENLARQSNVSLTMNSEVRGLKRNNDGTWRVTVADVSSGETQTVNSRYVFNGAGGAALLLLQESGIPEASQYAGFPVGGSFLYTTNPDVVSRHTAKVYGLAAEGSPPMSVPHLDLRYLNGQPTLFFGPFATFSTKFLKEGSWTNLFESMTLSNTWPMMKVGLDNFNLVQYLVGEVLQDREDRLEALRQYYPELNPDDWQLWNAGQRVQIIKKTDEGSKLQFGTEVVVSEDGTMSALIGASPGASTAPPIMLNLLTRVFPERVESDAWQTKLQEIIPSLNVKLADNPELLRQVRLNTSRVLELDGQEAFVQANLPGGDESSAAQGGDDSSEAAKDATDPVGGTVGDVENADEEGRIESATDA
ncbi:malate dehydrogenase (quinone) [Modicisalibacter luteus]|uniref:Probable malate:quinone oxidoreductase n=1 Tax=Modicisalibacter luteus TaxID=453962 RepID=A0ABV7LX24_9GAMM|nr:malate dehydrogenase (quinone) [Halomonas lutea]GHB10732.1 putative malate:quinone oxidoreductase [Halomonas lutea]